MRPGATNAQTNTEVRVSHFGLDNERYSTISRYVIATAIVLVLVVNVGIYLPQIGKALGTAGAWVLAIMNPLVIGGLAACLLWPAVTRVDSSLARVGILPRSDGARHALSVVIVVLVVAGLVTVIVSAILAFVTNSIRSISFGNLAELVGYVKSSMSLAFQGIEKAALSLGASQADVDAALGSLQHIFATSGGNLGQTVTSSFDAVKDFLSNTVLATVICVYFLIDARNLADYWRRALDSMLGENAYGHLQTFADDVRRAFTGYMRGQFIDALLMGIAVTISLSVVDVPYAVLIGIATGIGNLIPYVGPIVAYAATALSCLIGADLTTFVVSVIVLAVIQFVDGQIVNPKILSDSVEVHPIVVIVALIVGGKVGGVLGMFVAVPCAALVKIYFERFVAWRAARLSHRGDEGPVGDSQDASQPADNGKADGATIPAND